jgi:hypothetical protein
VAARLLLLFVSLLVAAFLIEGACRVYLWLWPPTGYVGRWEFRSQCPPPYREAEYFSRDFLLESMRAHSTATLPDTSLLAPGNFQGRHIHVSDHRRQTTDVPADPVQRVHLFGGSTLFCAEVPDQWTIASCLQRLLNARPGPRLAVENHGVCSMIARQQTACLLATPIQPGDVVIFYDGVNEVFYPVYNGNLRGWQPGDSTDGGVRQLGRVQRTLYPLCFRYKDASAIARLFFTRLEVCPPRTVANHQTLAQNLDGAEAGYRQALIGAQKAVARQGGRFVHFLQPNIFTLPHHSHDERRVIQNELKALPGLDTAFELGYPRLRNALGDAAREGIVSVDLSDALTQRRLKQQFYLDFCHVNHEANERIAQLIFEHAFGSASARR